MSLGSMQQEKARDAPQRSRDAGAIGDGFLGNAGVLLMLFLGAYLALAQRVSSHLLLAVPVLLAAGLMTWGTRASSEDAAAESTKIKGSKEERTGSVDEVDPIWTADWTNPEERGQVAKKLQESEGPRPVEVFELSDTPTWLVRLQQRRDQAQRASNTKLVQRLDKQISKAMTTKMSEPGPRIRPAAGKDAAEDSSEDDVWDMDWSKHKSEPVAVA
ncbi:unnamed protein product [Effrenium voratum]|uniref:Uncharacterized protein n=1 Tax=Effrenium voratum TaxID=2562239 RepID=A0AA36J0S6_9DINO|nr:unnamed protein product [Effrenium voratum]CAJ1438629.1 unnamed protein product [Effrenium voratum]